MKVEEGNKVDKSKVEGWVGVVVQNVEMALNRGRC